MSYADTEALGTINEKCYLISNGFTYLMHTKSTSEIGLTF